MKELEYQILYTKDNQIIDNGTQFGTLEDVQQRFPAENYAIIPIDELPKDWESMTLNMTIGNKKLVPATKAVIAKRKALKLVADKEKARSTKQVRFANETDSILFDAIEAFAQNHPEFNGWINAKAQIREEEGGVL